MLSFPCDMKRFTMGTMYRAGKRLQRPPLGAVALPDGDAKTGY